MEDIVKDVPEVVALDIETTGLKPEEDRIVEVALLKIKNGITCRKLTSFIYPKIKIPPSGLPVNKIKPFMLEGAPSFDDLALELADFIKGETLLIQNAYFDIPFLKTEFNRSGVKFPDTYVYDTLLLSKKLFSFERNSLSYLASFYKLDVSGMHRAEKDAMITYKIFCRFFKEKPLEVLNMKKETSEINYIDTPLIRKNIQEAMNDGREICIKYRNRNFEISTRRIEPIKIYNESGKWYLNGFCSLNNVNRRFRLDKILEVIDNI
ncbi:exonuclease domain-containing protein [bacterium]|nr:exonuclease domain-containing protein [bacterium]